MPIDLRTAGFDPASMFSGEWEPVPTRPLYVVSVVMVAAAIVLLPILYIAVVAGVAGLGLWHLIEHTPGAMGGSGRARARATVLVWFLYLVPSAACFLSAVFLLAPIGSLFKKREDRIVLTRGEEPKLHAFIDALCHKLGVRPPHRIELSAGANASAGIDGLLGFFTGRTVLTIGMPLAAGLSCAEFAGVMAHEFGHFRQKVAMRAGLLIRFVLGLFGAAAYSRGKLDYFVLECQYNPDGYARLFGLAVKLVLGASRLVLKVFLYAAWALESLSSRQMEYDADRYEVRLSGTECFIATHRRLDDIGAGFALAVRESADLYRKSKPRQLPNNLPALAADHATRITPERRREADIQRRAMERGLFLSHPPTEKRIAHAQKLGEPGILHAPQPASVLFYDFEQACWKATWGFFREELGMHLFDAQLIDTRTILAPRAREGAQRQVMVKYLGFEPPSWRPFFPAISKLPAPASPADAKLLVARIRRAKEGVRAASDGASRGADTFREHTEQLVGFEGATAALEANMRPDWKALNMQPTSRHAMAAKADIMRVAIAAAVDAMESAAEPAQSRLAAALTLLNSPAVENRLADAPARRKRATQLLAMLDTCRGILPDMREIREEMSRVNAIGQVIRNEKEFEKAKPTIRLRSDKLREHMMTVRERAGGTPYPYPNVEGATNLGERIIGATPGWREFEQIFEAGERAVERFVEDHRRAIAELVDIAAGVERDLARSVAAASPVAK